MKQTILQTIIQSLECELDRLETANNTASAGAMHSAPRAEKQRDTTGLEASYLAHGYSMKCATLSKQIDELKAFQADDFTGQEIDLGALIEVEVADDLDRYMLLPCGGGQEVEVDGERITVITPESPLGAALVGNFEAGYFALPNGLEGIILEVS